METARVGKVAVENTAYHFDKAYDYLIPKPFGRRRKGLSCACSIGGEIGPVRGF